MSRYNPSSTSSISPQYPSSAVGKTKSPNSHDHKSSQYPAWQSYLGYDLILLFTHTFATRMLKYWVYVDVMAQLSCMPILG